ncbi:MULTISPECIES: hypothetical protein [unclassified Nocardioides]|uniref:hypothetical protein n=1 Tax=unclassified Nocardioides TaxID=2615069 RepID=UPI0030146F0E
MLWTGDLEDAPPSCFETNESGELPTCSYYGGEWHRSFENSGDPSDGFGGFVALIIILGLIVAAGTAYWRVSTARAMARRSGLDEDEAARMALFTETGLETTYLASTMRRREVEPAPAPAAAHDRDDVADRLRRLDRLRDEELVSNEEWAERRRAILDEL